MHDKTAPFNEKLRRAALAEYAIINSGPEKSYDELTYLAAHFFDVPVAKISVIGKKTIWHKSAFGTRIGSFPRKNSFCDKATRAEGKIVCLNSRDQPEIFEKAQNVYNEDFKFFAGVPLINPKGHAIAVFCIFDHKPRELNNTQIRALEALANQAMNLFESRKQNNKLQQVQRKLQQKYKDLEKFASLVSHDIKSPLANIISLTELLKDENKDKLDDETLQYLDFLVESSYSLRNYVDGILSFYRSDHILEKDYEDVNLHKLLKGIADLYKISNDVEIIYPTEGILHNVNKAALTQVFMNLVSNALKYNYNNKRRVEITFWETEEYYNFEVKDNGNGIPKENLNKIFDLFATLDNNDRYGNPGSGIGLATVKKHIRNMQGEIEVDSEMGKGSIFKFRIKRL